MYNEYTCQKYRTFFLSIYNFVIKYYRWLDTFVVNFINFISGSNEKSFYNYTYIEVIFAYENINFQKMRNN